MSLLPACVCLKLTSQHGHIFFPDLVWSRMWQHPILCWVTLLIATFRIENLQPKACRNSMGAAAPAQVECSQPDTASLVVPSCCYTIFALITSPLAVTNYQQPSPLWGTEHFANEPFFILQWVEEQFLFFLSPWILGKISPYTDRIVFYPMKSKCGFKNRARRTAEVWLSLLTGCSTVCQLPTLVRLRVWHTHCYIFRSPANFNILPPPFLHLSMF